MNLLHITKMTEGQCRSYLEGIRWPDGPVCPHCGNTERIYALKGASTREGLYKCGKCRKQFTVTVKTVMADSHLSCKQWVVAFHLMCSSKKGISALQLQRELGMTSYESAWFLAHRIRAAMEEMNILSGTVEVDETYVGGKGTNHGKGSRYETKTPVVAMIERGGKAHVHRLPDVFKSTLYEEILETVRPDSKIMTDEMTAYRGIGRHFTGGHETVNHGEKEYARGSVHINTDESYFALLKRGVHGTFHHISRKHISLYCSEFSFRWNRRKIKDGERTDSVIRHMVNKRMTYQQLIGKDL